MWRSIWVVLLLSTSMISTAQTSLYIPRNISSTYLKQTRTLNGAPGPRYWQNKADYQLNVQYDPLSRYLSGTVDITYYNNSPDTLNEIWFKLYPNLYKQGTPTLTAIAPQDEGPGLVIEQLVQDNITSTTRLNISGTNMRVKVRSLLPGATTTFNIKYHYTVNKTSHNRTGEVDHGSAFLAYFFPRIAVYDDIDGWNENPYLGTQEFYNDFCNFKANISVPGNFVVWATGDLLNCGDVLSANTCQRLQKAETSDATVDVISNDDLLQKNITANNATNTFKFAADNVTDFVFALSDHYVWKSASVVVDSQTMRRTRVDAVFNPVHKDFYEVVDFAGQTVKAMSHRFPRWPFPYTHETIFDGLDQMEYPMMVNDNPVDNRTDAITLTDHEIFHTMFPFYMGINETKYAWMDEGWATLGEWLISPMIDPTIRDDYGMRPYSYLAGTEVDLPIMTPTTQLNGTAMFLNSYPKPALGYLFVKDMLGDSLFTKALHYYISQWNGKHPMPYDFFNCMNTGAGMNMNWFWQKWFFDPGYPNLAIDEVKQRKNKYAVTVLSKGSKPVPVDLRFYFSDGSYEEVHRDISIWQKGFTQVQVEFKGDRPVTRITLGSMYIPDTDLSDNVRIFR